ATVRELVRVAVREAGRAGADTSTSVASWRRVVRRALHAAATTVGGVGSDVRLTPVGELVRVAIGKSGCALAVAYSRVTSCADVLRGTSDPAAPAVLHGAFRVYFAAIGAQVAVAVRKTRCARAGARARVASRSHVILRTTVSAGSTVPHV